MKTALGSTESVAWRHFLETKTALEALRTEGYTLVAVEQADASLFLNNVEIDAKTGQKYALIFGNEVEGVSEMAMEMADFVLEIPQFGTKHSLNISVSVGIVAWEFVKALR